MVTNRGFAPQDSIFPFTGLNTLAPSTQAHPSSSPRFDNLVLNKGVVSKRRGYAQLGSTLTGTPMALINFQTAGGIEKLVCITVDKSYYYDGTTWQDITCAATDWTGDETDTVNWTVGRGDQGTWLIVTNGVDEPQYWDGGAGLFLKLSSATDWSFPGGVLQTCKDVKMFYNHLVLINATTTAEHPFSVFWSKLNSLVDFEDQAAGAGEFLFTDIKGALQGGVTLGDRLILYAEDSIGTMSYVGGDQIYFFEQLVQDTRLVSIRSVVNLGPYHLFLSKENVKLFDGTRLSLDIGDAISLTYREELDYDNRHKAFAFLDTPKNHVYFFVPTTEGVIVCYLLEYDLRDPSQMRWAKHTYTDTMTCAGFYTRSASLRWNSAELTGLTWAQLALTWDQASSNKGYPVRVFGAVGGDIFQADDIRLNDDGNGISGTYESPDFTASSEFLSAVTHWMGLELELRGTGISVYYSTDRGQSWTLIETLVLSGDWTRYKLDIRVAGRTIRFRLKDGSANGYFELRWLRAWYRPGGPL